MTISFPSRCAARLTVSVYILAEAKIIDRAMILDAELLPLVLMPNRDGFIPDARPEWFEIIVPTRARPAGEHSFFAVSCRGLSPPYAIRRGNSKGQC